MNKQQITIKDVIERWRAIVVFVIVFALIAFIVSALLPAKYQSDVSVIVVQKQSSEKIDAFSATKSAEFLSNIFTRVIYTTSFFNDVQDAPFDVRRNFSQDPEERSKEWKKFISVKKINNTGIINISVFDESRNTAEETAKAIAYILTTDSEKYHGGGERVTVRLIDGPNTPLKPTLPRILPNTIVGGIFGGILAVIFIYFFPNSLNFSEDKKQKTDENIVYSDEKEDSLNQGVASDHFNNSVCKEECLETRKEEIYSNAEVDELHSRISNFHESA